MFNYLSLVNGRNYMITVLRLGHRVARDKRISTHLGLAARAFGADKIIYSGERDESLLESIQSVTERWGGSFKAEYKKNWKKVIDEFKGEICHLTMYGLPIDEQIPKIRKKNLLVVVGGEKVPGEVYELATYNISISSQPHSEVSALAVFLDRFFKGKELSKKFHGKMKIIPSKRWKKVKCE